MCRCKLCSTVGAGPEAYYIYLRTHPGVVTQKIKNLQQTNKDLAKLAPHLSKGACKAGSDEEFHEIMKSIDTRKARPTVSEPKSDQRQYPS